MSHQTFIGIILSQKKLSSQKHNVDYTNKNKAKQNDTNIYSKEWPWQTETIPYPKARGTQTQTTQEEEQRWNPTVKSEMTTE